MASSIEKILDKLIKVQEKFYGEWKHAIADEGNVEGRSSFLEVVGPDGGSFKLEIYRGFIRRANGAVRPSHIIRIAEDAFLGILTRETTLDECFDKREAVILDFSDEKINIVELIKWKKIFNRLGNVIDKVLK